MAAPLASNVPPPEREDSGFVSQHRWKRFLHPYYAVNVLAILGYGLLRAYVTSERLTTKKTWTGLTQETEIIALLCLALASKYHKIATVDELVDRLFFYGKVAVLIMLSFISTTMAVWYALSTAAMFLVVKAPVMEMSASIEVLNANSFQDLVRAPGPGFGSRVAWVVMFHADWCPSSLNLDPMFNRLASIHGEKQRRFARLDVVAFPHVAEELNIDTSSMTKQLPTLILFMAGREVCRLPGFGPDGKVVRARMDQRGVTKYFELDKDFKSTSYCRLKPPRPVKDNKKGA